MERVRLNIVKCKTIKKLKSNRGDIGLQTILIVYFGLILIAFMFQVFTSIAIVSSARDTLDRATLSATSKAMVTPEVFKYLREHDSFGDLNANTLKNPCEDALKTALDEILVSDLNLTKNGTEYQKDGQYSIEIDSQTFDTNKGVFTVEATVIIPINIFNGSYDLKIGVTSNSRYANKDETTTNT